MTINYPVGLVGIWIASLLFIKTHESFWLIIGGGCYLFSWLVLLAGFILAGPEGLLRLRFFWRRTKRRIQFLHLRQKHENSSGTPGNRV